MSHKNVEAHALGHLVPPKNNLKIYSIKSYYEITLMHLLTSVIFAHFVCCRNQKLQIVQKLLCTTILNKYLCMNNILRASTFHFMDKQH